jgi:hypothetical protein
VRRHNVGNIFGTARRSVIGRAGDLATMKDDKLKSFLLSDIRSLEVDLTRVRFAESQSTNRRDKNLIVLRSEQVNLDQNAAESGSGKRKHTQKSAVQGIASTALAFFVHVL